MIRLVHKLKSSSHTIPIDTEKALQSSAFATIHHKNNETGVTHEALSWRLESVHDGKYEGHVFELQVTPESIEALERALAVAKQRFSTDKLPVEG